MDWWDDLVRAERESTGGDKGTVSVDPDERLQMTRRELVFRLETAANVGHHAGFNQGWARASVQSFGRTRRLRRLLAVSCAMSVAALGVLIWLLGR